MGRIFQSTTSNQPQAPSGGRIFGQQQSQPSGGRIFDSGPSFAIPNSSANSTQAISDIGDQGIIEKAVHKFGGTLGTAGRLLNVGTDIQKRATEKFLEKTGTLEETEGGIFKDVNKGSSNIDLLRRVGQENTKPDSVAGFFLGNYTPTNSVFGNFLREVPVTALGIGLDIALDPLSVVSKAGKVAEATKAAGNLIKQGFETLGAHIPAVQKIGHALGDLFVTRYGQRAEFQTLDRARKIEEQLNEQRVVKLVSPIIERPSAIQQRVSQVIKGGITTDEEIRKLAEPIRQELDRVGETISNINPKLLNPETFQANKGTYFPRLYKRYEFNPEEEIPSFFNKSSTKVPAERFKQRSLTEAEAQAQKDLVREAGYPALKGLSQLETAETRSKFFQQLSELASDVPQEGWLQLPDSKLLGDLGGKFLPKAEYESIQGILKTPGELEQMYGKALSTWKTFKTAYNPATISRNDITNFLVLNPLGGVGPHRLDIYAKTVRELMDEGELYKMAQKEGLELGSQSVAELKNRATRLYEDHPKIFQQFFSKVTDFHRAVVNFYGSQDKFFKLANFIKGVSEDGLKPVEAMKRANFYLVDYSEVPKFVEWLRKSPLGVPFISFTYGVSKPLAKTLLERPDKLAAYFKVLNGIQSLNPEGIPTESLANQEEVLPRWIKEGTYLRLPTRDKTGRGQYVDLQYILPFNTLEESSITPSSPVFTLAASIITGKDTFTGNEIYKDADTKKEKAQKVLTQIYRELAPSLFPGGFSFSKLKSAIEGRPDYQGRVRTILPVLIDVLGGVRITPVDQNQEAIKRANEKERAIRDLQTQLSVILKDKTLFPDEKQKESQEIIEKIKNVSTQKTED